MENDGHVVGQDAPTGESNVVIVGYMEVFHFDVLSPF